MICTIPNCWFVCSQHCEEILCSISGHDSYDSLLTDLEPKKGGGPCTAVWTAGTIAYRCKTCQITSSSAVCVSCFKAGGHENHDYVMYRSSAGGCCDCGDLSSWHAEGKQQSTLFDMVMLVVCCWCQPAMPAMLQWHYQRLMLDAYGACCRQAGKTMAGVHACHGFAK